MYLYAYAYKCIMHSALKSFCMHACLAFSHTAFYSHSHSLYINFFISFKIFYKHFSYTYHLRMRHSKIHLKFFLSLLIFICLPHIHKYIHIHRHILNFLFPSLCSILGIHITYINFTFHYCGYDFLPCRFLIKPYTVTQLRACLFFRKILFSKILLEQISSKTKGSMK